MFESLRERLFGPWRRVTDPVGRFLVSRLNSLADFDDDDTRDDAQKEAREKFLSTFAKRSWRYLTLSVLVLLLVAVGDMIICGTLQNQTYGLALDLTGAVILGRGLIKSPIPIAEESGQFWGYSHAIIKSLSKDAVDGIFGITFLIIGILFQFVAIANLYPSLLPSVRLFC